MDCYVCDQNTESESQCEMCRHELYPVQKWMRETTGDTSWTGSTAPFLHIHHIEARMVAGFIAGGQMPFKLIDDGPGFTTTRSLVRIPAPEFTYLPFLESL